MDRDINDTQQPQLQQPLLDSSTERAMSEDSTLKELTVNDDSLQTQNQESSSMTPRFYKVHKKQLLQFLANTSLAGLILTLQFLPLILNSFYYDTYDKKIPIQLANSYVYVFFLAFILGFGQGFELLSGKAKWGGEIRMIGIWLQRNIVLILVLIISSILTKLLFYKVIHLLNFSEYIGSSFNAYMLWITISLLFISLSDTFRRFFSIQDFSLGTLPSLLFINFIYLIFFLLSSQQTTKDIAIKSVLLYFLLFGLNIVRCQKNKKTQFERSWEGFECCFSFRTRALISDMLYGYKTLIRTSLLEILIYVIEISPMQLTFFMVLKHNTDMQYQITLHTYLISIYLIYLIFISGVGFQCRMSVKHCLDDFDFINADKQLALSFQSTAFLSVGFSILLFFLKQLIHWDITPQNKEHFNWCAYYFIIYIILISFQKCLQNILLSANKSLTVLTTMLLCYAITFFTTFYFYNCSDLSEIWLSLIVNSIVIIVVFSRAVYFIKWKESV